MEQIRAFIAIELPPPIRQALSQLQAQLKAGSPPAVKWVDPAGIHLTLKFLGSIAEGRVGAITAALEAAAGGIPPFRLEVNGTGAFPSPKRVQVVWVGLGGDTDLLSQLQQRLDRSLAPLGFAAESRPFTPHLTLARLRDHASAAEREQMGQLISATGFAAGHSFNADAVSLMRSQLTREGAIYSQLGRVNLQQPLSRQNV